MDQEVKSRVPKISLISLVNAAENEDWETVNRTIGSVCNEPPFIEWASNDGLYNNNSNLRDLGASILEISEHQLTEKEVDRLRELMKDKNIYVQYRSSFALFNHGARDGVVVNKIKSALGDEDVKEDAKKYLDQVK